METVAEKLSTPRNIYKMDPDKYVSLLSDNNTALNPNKLDKMDRISPPEPGTFGNRVTDNARMVTTISGIVEAEYIFQTDQRKK